ncbi:Hypothetical Protein FCC1311_058102 [Hondaea fermentalgiana]|uniref:Uncharacterized protein n=1 Tax=Hondaea fermentalgiana TaxID=2315210 RepID=A0A2R5GGX2_9STRA|nr:Hypothetical Protein FCC1311_058102 [Hondaea fermentalgiana]|eukprot:GBG29589.1 Hypothetical Protein FCC1311_058102 [Hondaea fermentalgiana]
MFPLGGNTKGLFGQDPGQNTVVIQCRHDWDQVTRRLNMRRRVDTGMKDAGNYVLYNERASLDPATVRVDPGDFVFQFGSNKHSGHILDNAIPVVSNLNGAYVKRDRFHASEIDNDTGKVKEDAVIARVTDDIRFIGFALGSTDPANEDEGSRKAQITTRVQGTMEIYNNGESKFCPGDIVLWKVPNSDDLKKMARRYGRSTQKVTPVLMPLRHASGDFDLAGKFLNMVHKDFDDPNITQAPKEEAVENIGSKFSLALLKLMLRLHVDPKVPDADADKQVEEAMQYLFSDEKDDYTNPIHGLYTSLKGKRTQKYIDEFVSTVFDVHERIRNRTVGVSLQYAKPGQKFTCLLGQN